MIFPAALAENISIFFGRVFNPLVLLYETLKKDLEISPSSALGKYFLIF